MKATVVAADLGQQIREQLLAVRLAFRGHIAVVLIPPIPAAAEVLQEDGRACGEELKEVFSIKATH